MSTHKLNLDVVLPNDASACDACLERLVSTFANTPGIDKVHVDRKDPAEPKLCLHYEPSAVALNQVETLVRDAGASLKRQFGHIRVPITGLRHERQSRLVEGALSRQPGVLNSSVGFGSQQVFIEFDPTLTNRDKLLAAIGQAGLGAPTSPAKVRAAEGENEHGHDGHGHGEQDHDEHDHGGIFGARTELIFSLACGGLTGVGWALAKAGVDQVASLVLFVIAYVLGSWFTLQEVAVALKARKFEIDFLMLLAAAGAAVLGEWFEGALLLFLFTLGHSLEGYAMRRARNAIEALAKLVPETALKLDDKDQEAEVPVSALVKGDRVLVKPNTRIPSDGFVISGTSTVNQAPVTGESVPVDKRPVTDRESALNKPEALSAENRVFAGTINGPAALSVIVTKAANESTLARVVQLVAEAETQKSPTQQFTDRFERIFVPIIVACVVLLLFAWVVVDEPFRDSFYRAMAVLVAASPCALAIATPSAVLSGVARAARAGVLIKGGAHLESLGAVRTIAFDKTGTLTEGKPRLTDVIAFEGSTEDELLAVAAAVEKQSDHPLAQAIVNGVNEKLRDLTLPNATNVESIIGYGVRANVAGSNVEIGKPGLFTHDAQLPARVADAVTKLQNDGRTVMVVRLSNRFLGALGVMDTPRESARDVIAKLHELGIEDTVMLTGDNQRVADAVAKHVGIRIARGDLLPEAKVSAIEEAARAKAGVAMVGDGVNDAPAMAKATVGIAMGAGGSDVALETADVALMADDLRALPFAIGLSRAANVIIRQNLWASLGMVAFLIPATTFGFVNIGVAVALHEGSTLLVVANALRLLAYGKSVPS